LKTHVAKAPIWVIAIGVVTIGALSVRNGAQTRETTLACDKREVRYSPFDASYGDKITLSEIKDSPGPLAEKSKKRSPQGTRYVLLQDADFNRPGPWMTTLFVGGVGRNGRLLRLSFTDHGSGGVQVRWLNEKLLFIEVWWGRIASTDLILDVDSATFLYKEMAEYGDMIQACH
jgi:hypothetical protein